MCPGGYPIQESQNWQTGFLPGVYQGTYINTQHTDIEKLIENIRNHLHFAAGTARATRPVAAAQRTSSPSAQRKTPQLEARIQSFELAYRMQMDASDAFDINARAGIHPQTVWRRNASAADCSSRAG